MRAQLRAPFLKLDRLYFSLGLWLRSPSRPKQITRLSQPSASLNEVTMGIDAPEPISTGGRPHSSARAAALACMAGVSVANEMAVPACLEENSAVQSAGSLARTKSSMLAVSLCGSWPATRRQVIFTDAFDGMTVLVPTP